MNLKWNLLFLLTAFCCLLAEPAFAGIRGRSGISLCGTFWKMNRDVQAVRVNVEPEGIYTNTGNGGGKLVLFSRLGEAQWLELSFGAVGRVETTMQQWGGNQVKTTAVIPVLLGFRHDLLSYDSPSSLIPYLAFGAGPYWLSRVLVRNSPYGMQNELRAETKAEIGGYMGGGVYFMFFDWIGLNMDGRYHFIDFAVAHDRSGWEYGLGLTFCWGKYR